ncbi:hypothetical protein FP742_08160 [Vibrio parahaemolyticus]|uniref:Uncharacterized protein n=1 Tax=Vibrio parahaemolyticus serotype O3:K6 (strain RIMD 2210633) TaxID=223926 RepID=Q87L16_VIBPA|nr:hypothetical protein A6J30_25230 [Vibrio parahaemolyticus]BAC61064.1 hypothetical protein [Vibrio parahaemolyticus RIMD 2210633]AZV69735.1 hypothetical protein D0853_01590 [Vibrio parahaemolyticus]EGQ8305823.1 hypothetical protein [Vibrio parahaemolyticus]EGQ8463546.1 hypothetical protein [Vibrio parahaemolyticus]
MQQESKIRLIAQFIFPFHVMEYINTSLVRQVIISSAFLLH